MVKMDRKLKFWGYDIYIDLESKSLNEYAAFVRKEYSLIVLIIRIVITDIIIFILEIRI